jgi:NDP-sugar pyrophosphorylase family protein
MLKKPMKTILICPSERREFEQLTTSAPMAALPLFGETVLDLWLSHLANSGVKQVTLLAADRVHMINDLVGSGERWGLDAMVCSEAIEPTVPEARKRHKPAGEASSYVPEPEDVRVVDHLPWDDSYPMFDNYASWFEACRMILRRAEPGFRVGMRMLKPGVWVGKNSQIHPSAELRGPCWLGRGVHVGKHAVIGPNVIVEDETFIDETAEISESWVGPQTFVGALTNISNSLAWGSSLINYRTGSHIIVPDPFLLSSVDKARAAVKNVLAPRRLPTFFQEKISGPIAAFAGFKAKFPG